MPKMADTVVIRKDDYQFLVDGEDFPWHISASGPLVSKLHDDLYAIQVDIFPIDVKTHESLPFTTADGYLPCLGGVEFPWYISEDGYSFKSSKKNFAVLSLTFIARHVDGDIAYDTHIDTVVTDVAELIPMSIEDFKERQAQLREAAIA